MDLNRDEIRRQLREIDALQRGALRSWRHTLDHLFDRDAGADASTATKAAVLGVPGRRQFLKVGSASVIGAAVLAACGTSGGPVNSTGTLASTSIPPTASTLAESATDKATDLVLLRTATSVELLAVAVYDKALSLGLLKTVAVSDAAKLFRDQHQEHADALKSATTQAGGQAYDKPNSYLNEQIVTPALPLLKTELDVVRFAHDLESSAASTYTYAGGTLGTPKLRQEILTIGGVEARHVAVLNMVIAAGDLAAGAPVSFATTTDAVGSAAYIK